MNRCFLIIGFAFTLSYFDGCGSNDQPEVHIKGPFPSIASCDQARGIYKRTSRSTRYSTTKCWKVPEAE